MRSFFDFLTRMALRFRAITLAIVVVVMILGGVAATELQQELLPPLEFPQSFVLIQVSGMTSDEVLKEQVKHMGIVHYYEKPFVMDQLVLKIKEILS